MSRKSSIVYLLVSLTLLPCLTVTLLMSDATQSKDSGINALQLEQRYVRLIPSLCLSRKNIQEKSISLSGLKGKWLRQIDNVSHETPHSKHRIREASKVFIAPENVKPRFLFAPSVDTSCKDCMGKLGNTVLYYNSLSAIELETELRRDAELADLYDYALALDYYKSDQSFKVTYHNGVTALYTGLQRKSDDSPVLLVKFSFQENKKSILLKSEDKKLILFDKAGGIAIDPTERSICLDRESKGECDYWQGLLQCLILNAYDFLWNICSIPCGAFIAVPSPPTAVACGVCIGAYFGFCAVQAAVDYCLFCDCNPFDDYLVSGHILHEDYSPWVGVDVGASDPDLNVLGWYTASDEDGYFKFHFGSDPGQIRVIFDRHCPDGQIVATTVLSLSPGENDIGYWWAPNCTDLANYWLWVYHEDGITPWEDVVVYVTDVNMETAYDVSATDNSGECFLSFLPGARRFLFDRGCSGILLYYDQYVPPGDHYYAVDLYECPTDITLEGRVVHEEGGSPWSGVTVYATDCDYYILDQSTTNSQGKYYLSFYAQDFILAFDRSCPNGELYVSDCITGLLAGDYEVSDVELPECPNTYPELAIGHVNPSSGYNSTNFYYYVDYYDADGDAPSVIRVHIDGNSGYMMSLYSGSEPDGTYRYGPVNLLRGTHNFYFYCEDGQGGNDRDPSTGTHSGPDVVNRNPELTECEVHPTSGTPNTLFSYTAHYYDQDGDAPTVRYVNIDGTPYEMSLYSGSSSNGDYIYQTYLSIGTHIYDFHFEDGYGGSASCGPYSGPTVSEPNYDPELTGGDVDPDEGTTDTTFRYTVHYYDQDGDPPETKYVYIDGAPHEMSLYSGSASNGWYRYQTTLLVGSHNYYFYFTDGQGGSDRLPSSGTYSGPNVSEPNNAPELTGGDVDPDEGTTDTTFRYTVHYYDQDGDPPETKYVYIDGAPHEMSLYSGSASNGWYRYQTTLLVGSHNYYFYFTDGQGGSDRLPSSGTYSGPTVTVYPTISGNIRYYLNANPIHPAELYITGGTMDTTSVDEYGDYIFANLPSGLDYCVKPFKEDDERNAITPYDASLVLRYSVGLIDLNPYQRKAADVSGNGSVMPYDASYILRYCVHLIDSFPVGDWSFVPDTFLIDTTNWMNAPDSICYSSLDSDRADQDYVGVLHGDVSGSWNSVAILSGSGDSPAQYLQLEDIAGLPGEQVLFPIEIVDVQEIHSFGLTLEYDPGVLEVISVKKGTFDVNHEMVHNPYEEGILYIAIASSEPISGSGKIAKVVFEVSKQAVGGDKTRITVTRLDVDQQTITGTPLCADFVVEKRLSNDYDLSQNAPNPFAEHTEIKYQLPRSSEVRLEVYDIMGRRAKVLVSSRQDAGFYRARWNGSNEAGNPVPSGIYFYRLKTMDFRQTRRMLLLR